MPCPPGAARLSPENKLSFFHPAQLYRVLDKHVLGQEQAKKSLSVILYQHQLRYIRKLNDMRKTNCLLIGPSGCGKSFMIHTLARILDLPVVSFSATSLVERGYRGGMHAFDIGTMLSRAARFNERRAQYGIVFIDEIDKLAGHDERNAVSSFGVQRDLLSIVEGYGSMPALFHEDASCDSFDFSNVLFVFAGAFQELTQYTNFANDIDHAALVKQGILPELVNRMGAIIPFHALGEEHLREMVRKEIDAYEMYVKSTAREKEVYVELIMTGIRGRGAEMLMGARAVHNAVQQFYEEKIFSSPVNEQVPLLLNMFDGKLAEPYLTSEA